MPGNVAHVAGGGRQPVSVVVTTLDNATTLERCLASVAWADEIVVLDSGSRDATLEIAKKYTQRIFSQPFAGYSAQKQRAIDLAAHDWVLLLDADEALGAGSRAAIETALENPRAAGFRLPRGGYALRLEAPLENFPSADAAADTARVNAAIERMVYEAPEQYLWVHKRFKTRPPGAPAVY